MSPKIKKNAKNTVKTKLKINYYPNILYFV